MKPSYSLQRSNKNECRGNVAGCEWERRVLGGVGGHEHDSAATDDVDQVVAQQTGQRAVESVDLACGDSVRRARIEEGDGVWGAYQSRR